MWLRAPRVPGPRPEARNWKLKALPSSGAYFWSCISLRYTQKEEAEPRRAVGAWRPAWGA